MNIQDLKSKGFVSIGYDPQLRQMVKEAQKSWELFCSLPDAVKRRFPYSNNSAGAGYEDKRIKSDSNDQKENFDLTTRDIQWLYDVQAIGDDEEQNRIVRTFIDDAASVNLRLTQVIPMFARDVEQTFGVQGFAEEVERSRASFFVRFIHYFPVELAEVETAEAHVDQSGMTPHLFESSPGLQYLTLDTREWKDMPVGEGQMVIIPSMQLQLRSEGKLTALCHRVISNPKTAKLGRYSAVCFVQFKETAKYDKATHGRLQEKLPGFNYDMNHEDFAQLFK